MRRVHLARTGGLAIWIASVAATHAADVSVVTRPYIGITHISRAGSVPDFPRDVKIHVVKVDTTTPSISFRFTAHDGTRDTLRQTTLQHLNSERAKVAINASFFLPFPSDDLNADLVGFGASNGKAYSPFELPKQNYALVRDAPAINIGPDNALSIVHRDPAFSDGTCFELCQTVDGTHIREDVTLGNAFAGSAQIVTNGVKTIPCYVDATHPDCELAGPGPANYSNSNSWYERVTARSAIGIGCDNKTLVLFTVDSVNGSAGMRVSEVADILIRDYAVCNALNMDGGGSTSLAMVDPVTGVGGYLNTPSDKSGERAVASVLSVFAIRADPR